MISVIGEDGVAAQNSGTEQLRSEALMLPPLGNISESIYTSAAQFIHEDIDLYSTIQGC